MTIATVLATVYYLWPGLISASGHRIGGLWGFPFVVAAAGIGKLIGIGVARLRLVLVYQRLRTKYEPRARHVYLHEMGRPSGHRV